MGWFETLYCPSQLNQHLLSAGEIYLSERENIESWKERERVHIIYNFHNCNSDGAFSMHVILEGKENVQSSMEKNHV